MHLTRFMNKESLMKMMYFAVPLLVSLLAGCQSAPVDPHDSHRVGIAEGAEIVLHEGHLLDGSSQRIVIEGGKFRDRQDRYDNYCYFVVEVDDSNSVRPSRLMPDTFRVAKVQKVKNWVGAYPIRVASFKGDTFFMDWVMHLQSVKQPFVTKLVCGVYADPFDYNYLTINQIKAVLGGLATVNTD